MGQSGPFRASPPVALASLMSCSPHGRAGRRTPRRRTTAIVAFLRPLNSRPAYRTSAAQPTKIWSFAGFPTGLSPYRGCHAGYMHGFVGANRRSCRHV